MRNEKPLRVVSFVSASSNSGKTTLIEKIVKHLKARGLRVAVVKHASAGFELDRPGKDSWRFQEAGADSVVLVVHANKIPRKSFMNSVQELKRNNAKIIGVVFNGVPSSGHKYYYRGYEQYYRPSYESEDDAAYAEGKES